jgi:arabinan endo-1,5-alpha-L-arabinosidase
MSDTNVAPRATRPAQLRWLIVAVTLLGLAIVPGAAAVADPPTGVGTFRNPLEATIPGEDATVRNCPDPSIISAHDQGDPHWYVYCTTDPLHGDDRDDAGNLNFRLMPILRSADLVDWTYVGDVFEQRPDWVGASAGLWAPEIAYRDGTYYLYYSASATSPELGGHSAIGVATAPTPAGPWTDSGAPAVEPRSDRWTIDPAVLEADGTWYLYFGSYFGGLWVRELSEDGLGTIDALPTVLGSLTINDARDAEHEAVVQVVSDGKFTVLD